MARKTETGGKFRKAIDIIIGNIGAHNVTAAIIAGSFIIETKN